MKTTTPLARPVGEIMQTQVTTVSPRLSVRELTRVLADQGITGAPVVTPDGHLVGVVSSSDVIRLTADAPDIHRVPLSFETRADGSWVPEDDDVEEPTLGDYFLPEEGPTLVPSLGEDVPAGLLDEMVVEDIMTGVLFSVSPHATVAELVDFLARGRIHRAVVADEGRLVGIVTATDILRALAGLDPDVPL